MSNKKEVKSYSNQNAFIWLTGILIITFIAFSPSLKNGFTNWDDNIYIAENNLITDLSANNLKKIFDTDNQVALNYHPITILSLAIDYKLSQYNPKTYHTTNLLFHLQNTALVFWFIFLLSGKKIQVAAIVALFFGIHPMHMESVAWIAERKDVLYVFFFMAALISYYKYMYSEGKTKLLLYTLTLLLFLLSVLSKAMAVVLPMVLLLIDYYQNRKLDKHSLIEKIPFFILSFLFGVIAFKIQSQGAAIAKLETFTWLQRFEFASYGMIKYIFNLFIPLNLANFYPYPNPGNIPGIYFISPFIVLVLLTIIWGKFRNNRTLVFGFLFYLITIALVLQFITVGKVIMADRYSYLSYIGLLFPIAIGFNWLQEQQDKKYNVLKKVTLVLTFIYAFLFFVQTYQRTKVWKNSDTLWTDAIDKYPNAESYQSRASYLVNKSAIDIGEKSVAENEYERALEDYTSSIKLNPINASTYTGRANIYSLKGQYDLALNDYSKAIELNKTDAQTFYNRAGAYILMKQFDKAIEDYNAALLLDPNTKDVRKNRSYAYISIGNYQKAIDDLNELIKIEPSNADYYFYRSFANFKMRAYDSALADNTVSIQLNPNNAVVYYNRSSINKALAKFKEALNDALKAQSMGYDVDPRYLDELKGK